MYKYKFVEANGLVGIACSENSVSLLAAAAVRFLLASK